MPYLPPTQAPPVLLSLDFSAPPPELAFADGITVADGRLQLAIEPHQTAGGAPFGDLDFHDVTFETSLRLTDGDANDYYGVFVRRARSGRYITCAISPAGDVAIRFFDGHMFNHVAHTELPRGMHFAAGLGEPNLLQVVACGTQLAFLLNGRPALGVMIDRGLAEGGLGMFVHHGGTSARAVVEADWAQVRAILPQPRFAQTMPNSI